MHTGMNFIFMQEVTKQMLLAEIYSKFGRYEHTWKKYLDTWLQFQFKSVIETLFMHVLSFRSLYVCMLCNMLSNKIHAIKTSVNQFCPFENTDEPQVYTGWQWT